MRRCPRDALEVPTPEGVERDDLPRSKAPEYDAKVFGTESPSAKEILELFGAEPGVPCDCAHCVGVDRVVSRNGKTYMPVGHHDMPALAQGHKAGFLEGTDRLIRADAGYLWQEAIP